MSVFDGMAALVNGVLGAAVIHIDAAGVRREVTAVLRERRAVYVDQEGREVTVAIPEVRLPATLAGSLAPGDLIVRPGDGKRFRVMAEEPGGSPADDATRMWRLEAVIP